MRGDDDDPARSSTPTPPRSSGQTVAVVGYGNQGRSWALNLRDSGLDVRVCVRADETREQATADGFAAADVEAATGADVICILVPDDAIPTLPLAPEAPTRSSIVASGYTLAFDRLHARRATSAWSRPGCSGPRCGAATRRASASSPRVGVHARRDRHRQARALASPRRSAACGRAPSS